MTESVPLLLAVIAIVFVGLHDGFSYFFEEKEHRRYWMKWWLALSVLLGLFFWLVLMIWGK